MPSLFRGICPSLFRGICPLFFLNMGKYPCFKMALKWLRMANSPFLHFHGGLTRTLKKEKETNTCQIGALSTI